MTLTASPWIRISALAALFALTGCGNVAEKETAVRAAWADMARAREAVFNRTPSELERVMDKDPGKRRAAEKIMGLRTKAMVSRVAAEELTNRAKAAEEAEAYAGFAAEVEHFARESAQTPEMKNFGADLAKARTAGDHYRAAVLDYNQALGSGLGGWFSRTFRGYHEIVDPIPSAN